MKCVCMSLYFVESEKESYTYLLKALLCQDEMWNLQPKI